MDFVEHGRGAVNGRDASSPGQSHTDTLATTSGARVITSNPRGESSPQAAGRSAANANATLAAVSNLGANVPNGPVTRVVPGPDGLVHLPADTSLQSIHVSGRDLVVQLPDGSRIVIVDGAVFTPHLVIGDVDVPVQNLAALLIDNEVQAAAGPPQSAGGNFAVPPGEIGPGFGISPLLPPNSLSFGTNETRLLFPAVGRPGETIITPGGPPGGLTSATESVQEAGLAGIGSHAGDGSNVATGVIDFSAPNQPATLTIEGTKITAVGQVIHGANGTLTITSIAPGAVGYSYTLTDPTPNKSVADVFSTTVTDSIGQTASATLTIDPIHDHPTANPDVASDGVANFAPISGNVVTAAGDTNVGGADVLGADRPTLVTGIAVGGSATSFTTVSSGAGGTTITSSEGTLTIHQDGSYTYTRAAGTPGGVTDTFTYQITDQDGATSTTTLSIGVAGDLPTITIPAPGSAGTVVLESGLATGSAPGAGVTTTGTISFTPGDGPDSFTINGAAVSVGASFTGAHGTLTITSIDLVHDTVGYSYTLTSSDPSLGRPATEPVDSFAVVLTDQDGNHASGTLVISDVEDKPTAHVDITSDGAANYAAISGNVVTAAGDTNVGGADTLGADRPSVVSGVGVGGSPASLTSVGAAGATITSSEGSLTIHQDGSYTYTRAAGTPGGVTDTFTYQLTDADGSTSTTTLSIDVGAATATLTVPAAGSAGTVVLESGLATGSAPGVGVTTSGTIAFTPGDGPDSFTINGGAVSVGATFTGAHGTLTITSIDLVHDTIGYSYTLTSADPSLGRPATEPVDSFAVVLTDQDGNHVPGTLVISDVEDKPTAHADSQSDGTLNFAAISGNVVTGAGDPAGTGVDVKGADTPTNVTGIALGAAPGAFTAVAGGAGGTTITSSEGSLTIHQDGSYTYTRAAGTPGGVTDTFTYQLTDADGSTSTTTLSIDVGAATATLTVPAVGSAGTVVLESALPTGSAPGAGVTTSGTIAFTPGDGPDSFTINGGAVSVGATFTGTHGTLTITSIDLVHDTIGYSYTLTSADPSAGRPATEPVDSFAVVLTDQDGNHVPGTLVISDVEDKPTANPDVNGLTEGASVTTTALSGVVSNDVLGADRPDSVTGVATGSDTSHPVSGNVGTAVTTGLGTLTLSADGSYKYVAAPNTGGGTDHFVYTLTDADGSTSTTTLTINVAADTLAAAPASVTVDESGLPTGSTAGNGSNIVNGTLTGDVSGGSGGDTFSLVSQTGAHGTVTLSANGDFTYTLNSADPGAGRPATEPVDSFTYQVTDSLGNTTSNTVTVNDLEDHPTAIADVNSLTEGASVTTTALTGVVSNDVLGADRPDSVTGVATGIDTSHAVTGNVGTAVTTGLGTLTLDADGSYKYVAAPNTGGGTDHFVYTLTDADGSTSTTTLTITVAADTLAAKSDSVTVDESGLPTGSTAGNGSNITSGASVAGDVSGGSGGDTFSLVSQTGHHGAVVLNSDGTFTYTLTSADPSLGRPATEAVDTFTYKVTDSLGNSVVNTVTVNDVEDKPTANPDTNNVTEGLTITTTAATGTVSNDVLGADRPDSVTGIATGSDTSHAVTGNVGTAITTALGTLTVGADGSYTYTAKPGTGGNVDHFVYTLTDADGTTSTTTLDINIASSGLAAHAATVTVDESGLPTGSTAGNGSNIVNSSLAGDVTGGTGGNTYTLDSQTGVHGTVVVDPATGAFTYTLTSADPGAGRPATEAVDSFTYTVTDSHGNTSTNTVTVDDVEDRPTANPDVNSLTEGATATTTALTGVVSNDVLGADRPDSVTGVATGSSTATPVSGNVGSPITTTLGTLTLAADGSYKYVAAPNTGGGTDHFVYTLTDADGTTSTTTLTITVAADTLAAKSDSITVDESGLPTGSTAGNNSNIGNGNLTGDVSGGSGGDTFSLVSQTGHHGTVMVNANGTYTYTLTSADPSLGRPATEPVDSFVYKVTDSLGNTTTNTVTVNDLEDHPTAVADVNSLTEGASVTTTALTGVVSNDVLGADRPDSVTGVATGTNTASPVSGNVGSAIHTTLGTLTLASDGSYLYTANPNTGGGTDHFVYTLTDADGSTSTTTLTITVAADNLAAKSDSITVDESGLPTGSTAGDNSNIGNGNLAGDVSGGSGGNSFTLVSQTGVHGTVSLNANGTYTYTLTSADPSAGRPATEQVDSFTYKVTDSLGNSTMNTVIVNDVEDHPTAKPDTNSVEEGATVTTTALTGVVSNDVLGADRPDSVTGVATGSDTSHAVTGNVGSSITTALGTLTLNSDGSYQYTAKPGTTGQTDHFVYTLSDADGSTSTTTLNITITADNLAAGSSSITVDESGLATGSTPGNGSNIGNGNLTGLVSGGSGGDTFSLVSQTGVHGTVAISSNGAFTYTLSSADPSSGRPPTEQVDSFTYKVTDSLGNSTTNTVIVNDVEDKPSIAPANASSLDNATPATPIVTTANLNFVAGADRPTTITDIHDTGDDNGGVAGTVSSGGVALVYTFDAGTDTLTATAGAGGATVFTLTETPGTGNAPGTGTYTFTLDQPLDGPFVPISSFTSGGFGAGPNAQGQELKDSGTSTPISLLAGFDTTAGFVLGGATDITSAHPDANVGGVNGSTTGFGIDTNNFTHDQLFVVEFQTATGFPNTGNGGFIPPAFTGPAVNATTFEFSKATTGEYQVHYTDGSTGVVTSFTNATSISIAAGKDISYVEILNSGNSNGKFLLGSASAEQQVANAQLNFSTTVTDADGSVGTGTFHVTVTGATHPVVLDLSGQGLQFVGESAGVTFDYGSGLVSTAWAAPGEGVLALHTASGLVVDFSPAGSSLTDLQGLAAFDTNHDGKLDAGDAQFSSFGAIVDGKFETLSQLGVTSVNLTSNNTPYAAAGGQVQVAGTGTFTYANGKTGALADASFATAPLNSSSTQQSELAANENASLAGAAAAAAAGVLAASLGLGASQPFAPSANLAPTNGATMHTDDVAQLDHQVTLANTSGLFETGSPSLASPAESEHFQAPSGLPTAASIDLSSLSGLDALSSHLGASGGGQIPLMASQVFSSQVVSTQDTAFAGPQSLPMSGAALVGGIHGAQAATLAAAVLADALPGVGHGGNTLANLIEGLPASTPNIGAAVTGAATGVAGIGAGFHAAMMGPGFGAFEFANDMAMQTHHSLTVSHA